MADVYEDEVDVYEDVPDQGRQPILWNARAAKAHVQKLSASADMEEQDEADIYNQLTTRGESGRSDEITNRLHLQDQEAKVASISEAVNESGVEAASLVLEQGLKSRNPNVVTDAAMTNYVANSGSGLINDPDDVEALSKLLDEETALRESFEREFAEASKHTSSTLGGVLQFVESMVPFVESNAVSNLGKILKKHFNAPLDSTASAFLLQGDYIADMRDWITDLPREDQLDVFEFILDNAEEVAGGLSDNEFIKVDLLQKVFAGARDEYLDDDTDVTAIIGNAISLLDVTMVGQLAGKAVKGVSFIDKSSSLATAQRLDKDRGGKLAAASLVDATENTAAALGTTKADILADTLIPKYIGYGEDPLVSEDFIERQIKLMQEIKDRDTGIVLHMSEVEKAAQKDSVDAILNSVGGVKLRINSSSTLRTDEGITVNAIYGKNADEGFTLEEMAVSKTRLEALFPTATVEHVQRNGQTLLKLTVKDNYKVGTNVIFNIDDILARGSFSSMRGDISANLSKNLSDSFYVAFDKTEGIKRVFSDLLKPFSSASSINKSRILGIIDRVRDTDVELTVAAMVDMLPRGVSAKDAQEIIKGVISIRSSTDAAYVISNKVFREKHLKKNRRWVHTEGFDALAAPVLRDEALGSKVAFNPSTGDIVKLTDDMINDLYNSGGQIAKSSSTHGGDSAKQTTLIIVDDKVAMDNLPQKLLKYDANNVTTIYKDQYFITTKAKALSIDGVAVDSKLIPTRAIATAGSRKEAEEAVARMQKDMPNVEMGFKNDRKLTSQQSREAQEQLYSAGGLFFSPKGDKLHTIQGSLSELADPVASIRRQATSVASLVELRPMIDLMKQRFINTFGDLADGKFPSSRNAINDPALVNSNRAEAAKVMWDHIDQVDNVGVMSQKWQAHMVGFGEWLESGTGSAKLGTFVRTTIGEKDPISAVRGATFMATIVFNPARQLFVQSQQFLFLTGLDPKYVMSGSMSRQGGSLLLSSIGDKSLNHSAMAKVAGMSTKEYTQAVDAYARSGLNDAVDSHIIGRDAMIEVSGEIAKNRAGAIAGGARDLVAKGIQGIKDVGFNAGERVNLAHTYMLARKRFKEKHPSANITSKEAEFSIAADARQLALGMTRAGSFAYQDGVLSLATQFFSFQHKAGLVLMRGVPGLSKYGNKAITPQEARRIMKLQLGIYGGASMGINAVIEEGIDKAGVEVSPEVLRIMQGGAYDLVMNGILEAATGEEANFAFASNLAAGQGFGPNLLEYIRDISSGNKSMLEIMSGASSTVGSRFSTAFNSTAAIMGSTQPLTTERTKEVLTDWAAITSGYSQLLRGDAMLRLETWVDKNRNSMPLKATTTEAIITAMIGVPSDKLSSLYHNFLTGKEAKERLKTTAEEAFGRISRHVGDTRSKKDGGFAVLDAMNQAIDTEFQVLKGYFTDADMSIIEKDIMNKIKKRVGKDGSSLLEDLSAAILNNTYGEASEDMINFLTRHGMVSDKDSTQLLNVLNVGMGVE